jgi:hypothetical protein
VIGAVSLPSSEITAIAQSTPSGQRRRNVSARIAPTVETTVPVEMLCGCARSCHARIATALNASTHATAPWRTVGLRSRSRRVTAPG